MWSSRRGRASPKDERPSPPEAKKDESAVDLNPSIESDLWSATRRFQEATFRPIPTTGSRHQGARRAGTPRGLVWRTERSDLTGHPGGFSIVTLRGRAPARIGGRGSTEDDGGGSRTPLGIVIGTSKENEEDVLSQGPGKLCVITLQRRILQRRGGCGWREHDEEVLGLSPKSNLDDNFFDRG